MFLSVNLSLVPRSLSYKEKKLPTAVALWSVAPLCIISMAFRNFFLIHEVDLTFMFDITKGIYLVTSWFALFFVKRFSKNLKCYKS